MSSRISFHHDLRAVTNETADEEQRPKKSFHVRKDLNAIKMQIAEIESEAKTVTRNLSR
jgi:hypothetical protein